MPFLPFHLKDFGMVKVRHQQPGPNGEDNQHLSTKQALMGKLREGCPFIPGKCWEFLARWESCFQDENLPLAAFASGIHSYLYLITGLAENLPFEKKKNSGESFLFRHRLREKTRDSHSLLSQAAHNWVEVRGCSKLSVSNPQLSSFLTEALGSRADGVSPVHVSSADRNPRLEAVCLEQRETPSLALSWCSQRTVKTLLKPEPT